jgi:hypothetical protein
METERISFNSRVSRESYAVIRDEAFKLGISVKEHISNIITNYAELNRKEENRYKEIFDVTLPDQN